MIFSLNDIYDIRFTLFISASHRYVVVKVPSVWNVPNLCIISIISIIFYIIIITFLIKPISSLAPCA